MENITEEMKENLGNILLKDTGLFDTSDNFYPVLRKAGINTVAQILDDDLVFQALLHCREVNRQQIRFLVSMVKCKYLGETLPNIDYLSKKFNLNAFDEDKYNQYFIFEDGEKVHLWNFFSSSKTATCAKYEYHQFCIKKRSEYPDDKAPFIDFVRFLLSTYDHDNRKYTFNGGYEIVKTYVDAYDGIKSTNSKTELELKNIQNEQILFLQRHLKDLTKMRNELDGQILKIQSKIEQLSNNYDKGGIKR